MILSFRALPLYSPVTRGVALDIPDLGLFEVRDDRIRVGLQIEH